MARHLRLDERALVEAMLAGSLPLPLNIQVEDMDDGGMGSLRFISEDTHRRFGARIKECQFADLDDVPVFAAIILDKQGNLYELDVWKVDFSPLKKIPAPSEIRPPD